MRSEVDKVFGEQVGQQLHEKQNVPELLFLSLLLDAALALVVVRVHPDHCHRVLVQNAAVGVAEVTEAPLGAFAEQLQNEFDDGGVVVEEAEQVDHAAKNRVEEGEQLLHGGQVDALNNTWKMTQH